MDEFPEPMRTWMDEVGGSNTRTRSRTATPKQVPSPAVQNSKTSAPNEEEDTALEAEIDKSQNEPEIHVTEEPIPKPEDEAEVKAEVEIIKPTKTSRKPGRKSKADVVSAQELLKARAKQREIEESLSQKAEQERLAKEAEEARDLILSQESEDITMEEAAPDAIGNQMSCAVEFNLMIWSHRCDDLIHRDQR